MHKPRYYACSHISCRDKGRLWEIEGQIEWTREWRNRHHKRKETHDDVMVSRRGKWEHVKAERTLESQCDRQAEEEESRGEGGEERGKGGRGRDVSWVKAPPSSPDSSVKDTVLKRWIACALSAKACPRQWHHHHQTRKDTRREPQTHAWIFYSLLFTHLFIIFLALRLSLCTDNTDHEVFILTNRLKIK